MTAQLNREINGPSDQPLFSSAVPGAGKSYFLQSLLRRLQKNKTVQTSFRSGSTNLLDTCWPPQLPGSNRLGTFHSMMLVTRETDA